MHQFKHRHKEYDTAFEVGVVYWSSFGRLIWCQMEENISVDSSAEMSRKLNGFMQIDYSQEMGSRLDMTPKLSITQWSMHDWRLQQQCSSASISS
jgi:hypothetical protein